MSRLWRWIKDHPYVSTAIVFGSLGSYIYYDQKQKQAEMEERIRRNRLESEKRDRARREANAANAASSSNPKVDENAAVSPAPEPYIPPMPRTPSLSRLELEQWASISAPDFQNECFFEGGFEDFNLSSNQGKWVILLFVPLELTTSGSTYQNVAAIETIIQLQEKHHEFLAKHCEIVVVCPESKHYLKKLAEAPRTEGGLGGVDFPLVSDINSVAASLYGLQRPDINEPNIAALYILAPHMVIQSRETHNSSHRISADHILSTLTELQEESRAART